MMHAARLAPLVCVSLALALGACSDEGSPGGSGGETSASGGSGDGDGDPASGSESASDSDSGDGDGDTSASGDGDGDATASGDGDASTTDSGDGDGDPPEQGFGPWCEPPPACDAPPPPPGPELDWEHVSSNLIVLSGDPNHRVRDMFYVPGETQYLMAKFSYGLIDKDLKDERVDVYLLRGCAGEGPGDWEFLGEAWTSEEGSHPTVQGVEDSGGWVFFELSEAQELDFGRHRVHMVVRGDQTTVEGFIEVVEPGTPLFLSDVDGTLTTFESEEFVDLLLGVTPDANQFAATALGTLQAKGYHAMYLTARPEFLVDRTREFVAVRGFPPGIIHTSLSLDGALGDAAVEYKTGELQMLADKGLVPTWVFGNTESDGGAYDNGNIQPLDHRVFYQFDDPHGGRRIESYGELIDEYEAMPHLCE